MLKKLKHPKYFFFASIFPYLSLVILILVTIGVPMGLFKALSLPNFLVSLPIFVLGIIRLWKLWNGVVLKIEERERCIHKEILQNPDFVVTKESLTERVKSKF